MRKLAFIQDTTGRMVQSFQEGGRGQHADGVTLRRTPWGSLQSEKSRRGPFYQKTGPDSSDNPYLISKGRKRQRDGEGERRWKQGEEGGNSSDTWPNVMRRFLV